MRSLRFGLAAASVLVLLAVSVTGSTQPAEDAAPKAPFPEVSEELWREYVEVASKRDEWKRLAAFKPEDVALLAEQWQRDVGLKAVVSTNTVAGSLFDEALPVRNGILTFTEVQHPADSGNWWTVLKREDLDGGVEQFFVPATTSDTAELQYVYRVSFEDPFAKGLQDVNLTDSVASIVRGYCERIGCDYVLPAETPRVTVRLRQTSVGDLMTMVSACAGYEITGNGYKRLSLWGPSTYTRDLLKDDELELIMQQPEGWAAALYQGWFKSVKEKIRRPDQLTVMMTATAADNP